MSVTLHHLSRPHLCARRRWLYNTLHTLTPSSLDCEQSNRKDVSEKTGDKALSRPKKGTKRKIKITGPSLVENSKIRQHLDSVESTKHNLTLEDVERYKPHKILDSRQPTYDDQYREVQNALIQSFTRTQLLRFLELYGLPSPPSSKTKDVFVEILMKHWGLEPLAKVREERADWRVNSERLYPMSPAYAFLFLGKNGANLLNLAKQYNVHLSFIPDPLSLRIEGLKGAVKQLDGYMKNFEDDIASETTRIPHGLTIPSQITRSISHLSGAHVKTSADGELFITYRKSDPASANRVKRLAVQAASKQADVFESTVHALGESPSVVAKVEESEPSHSFYPFFSPQISVSAFRLRRVGQWLRAGARYNIDGEDVDHVSLSKDSMSEIKTRLLDEMSTHQLPNSKMVVTATPGHILFLAPSGQTTFKPPIPGSVKQDDVLKWAKENPSQVFFNPTAPKLLMTLWPHMQSQFQRIVFKALPIKSESVPGESLRRTLVLEILPRLVTDDPDSEGSDVPKSSQIIGCERRVETHADILLPSRSSDIRISVSHVETIASSKIPKELRSFAEQIDLVTDAVNPPLTLTLDGIPYILSSTSQIRRDHRQSSKSPKEFGYDFIVETPIDPEDGQQPMVCKVPCSNPSSSDWSEFFTRCDHISMMDSKPSKHPLAMMVPWFRDSDTEGMPTENRIDHSTRLDSKDSNSD